MRFSKTTQSFYPEAIEYPNLPADVVTCTHEEWEKAVGRKQGEKLDFIDGKLIVIPAPPKPVSVAKSEKMFEAAAKRYAKETSGIRYKNVVFHSDRASVAMLDSSLEKIRRGVVPAINWKCKNGEYITLNKANAAEIELLVLTHVQACFEAERALVDKITASTTTAEAENLVVSYD